jgi:non-heme chloroperoxidase
MSLDAGVDTLLGFVEGISLDDDRELLPRIEAQTLILSSTAGLEVPGGVGLYLRDQIPRAHLAELPGADHFAFATRPALVNLLIEQILPVRPCATAT